MEILYLLIPLALLLVAIIVGAFWWASHTDQFDDLEGPAYRILMDDTPVKPPEHDEPGGDDGTDAIRKKPADP
ncbi:MAG: cbb3-type cytochrome oxidase assembly protein CcoS [Pseudomonadota bacterium]|nr:cbb3-type cytochrome oxidase assembly protein CcoS [Pseudomonadota bacterium]